MEYQSCLNLETVYDDSKKLYKIMIFIVYLDDCQLFLFLLKITVVKWQQNSCCVIFKVFIISLLLVGTEVAFSREI